jgi:hypothetical protein
MIGAPQQLHKGSPGCFEVPNPFSLLGITCGFDWPLKELSPMAFEGCAGGLKIVHEEGNVCGSKINIAWQTLLLLLRFKSLQFDIEVRSVPQHCEGDILDWDPGRRFVKWTDTPEQLRAEGILKESHSCIQDWHHHPNMVNVFTRENTLGYRTIRPSVLLGEESVLRFLFVGQMIGTP